MIQLADDIQEKLEGTKTEAVNDVSCSSQLEVLHYISSAREILRLPISNWYEVGIALKLDHLDLQSIQETNAGSMEICKAQMLTKWFESNSRVSYEDLVKALSSTSNYDNKEVAQALCKRQGISESILNFPSLRVEKYIKDVKSEYLRSPILKKDPWPPPPCEEYVDLVWANFSAEGMSVEDSLSKTFHQIGDHFRMFITGMPGVGKTTLCKHIAKQWAEGEILQKYDILLLVQLRDPEMSGARSWEDLFYHDDKYVKEKVVSNVGQESGNGVLFIFDGFDELSKKDRCRGCLFSDIFNGKKLKRSSIIITSRPYASQHLEISNNKFYYIELIGFDEDLLRTCIKKSIVDQSKAEQLITRIMEDDNLKALCTIPNNLAIVIYIYKQENGKLPTTLTELYTKFITNTIDRNSRELKPSKRKKYRQCLEELAHKGLTEDKLTFNVADMSIEEGSTLGLMTANEKYTSSGHIIAYNFLHLTIQEYLAACLIARNFTAEEQVDFVKKNYLNSRFCQTILFLAGITKLRNVQFHDVLSLLLENALTNLYIHVTNGPYLHDKAGMNHQILYSPQYLESLILLISVLYEGGEEGRLNSNYLPPESSNHILLLNFKHLQSTHFQTLLGSFIFKSDIIWERLEIIFDQRNNYERFIEPIKDSCCKVSQLGLHTFSLLNCSKLLECSAFDELEYLRVDSALYTLDLYPKDFVAAKWGSDIYPREYNKLKDLLKNNQLKHLLLNHITTLEAEHVIEQSVTPYLAKCKSLQTLCLHFERNVSSELLIDLFKAIERNKSIVILNLSIGFDSLAVLPAFNSARLLQKGIKVLINLNERKNIINALTKMIKKNKTIENLSITRTESIRENVFHWVDSEAHFMPALISAPRITKLTISCNVVYMPLLEDLLKFNKTVTSLTLTEVDSMHNDGHKYSKGVFIYLAIGLRENVTLKRLCLNSKLCINQPGEQYTKRYKRSVDVGIYWSKIATGIADPNISLFHLLNALQCHSSLEELVFDYYSICQQKRILLFSFVYKSGHIPNFCSFSDKNQKALCNLLLNNRCLQSLTISGFNFTTKQLQQVGQALVLNGHKQSFKILLTKILIKEKQQKDLLDFSIREDEPRSDIVRALALASRSLKIDTLRQACEAQDSPDHINGDDSEKSSNDTNSGDSEQSSKFNRVDSERLLYEIDYDWYKEDNNGDIIQEEVETFKEIMFKAMVTVFSHILCIRQAEQTVL